MKKTNSMKIAVVMLALALITSCFAGGTFAKYTTSNNADGTARVAKFGVVITADGSTFAKEYDTNDTNVAGTIAKSVVSSEDVVAPGTKGNMVAMSITGTPEVAVTVAYSAKLTLDKWTDADGNFYCPIEIKVGDTTIKGTSYTDKETFVSAVEEAISTTANYAAGANLSAVAAPSVSWAWAFEGNTDANDTYLGDQAAAGNGATIGIEVIATVTQID